MIALNARSFRETKLDSNFDTYKDIQIEFMEDVGHFIMLERPDEFNEWLEAKISEWITGYLCNQYNRQQIWLRRIFLKCHEDYRSAAYPLHRQRNLLEQ